MYLKYILITLCLFISSCGGGSSSGDDDSTTDSTTIIDASQYYSQEESGDVVTYTRTTTINNGSPSTITLVSTFEQVDSIPADYSYSGSGPFLQATIRANGATEPIGYIFTTTDGDVIINDSGDYFTSIQYTTITGTDEPTQVVVGQTYPTTAEETLFRSSDGLNVGSRRTESVLTAVGIENITVSGADHEALRFDVTSTITDTFTDNTTDLSITTSETWWFVRDLGLVKQNQNRTTVSELGTSTSYTVIELLL